MSEPVKLVAVAGSIRSASYNRRVLDTAVEAARAAGAQVQLIDLREYPMPIFDQDLEAQGGTPDAAKELRRIFRASDGMLLASPEYNGSLTPLMKNTIDWISRADDEGPSLSGFSGKVAAIMSASPGALGGLRGLAHLRAILSGINVLVLPKQVAVSHAADAFMEDGSIKDPKRREGVQQLAQSLVKTAARLRE